KCFIGARSEVAEGVIVREGSVLSMGVYLGASTRIVDRETSAIYYGEVPAYSVVVPGSMPGKPGKDGAAGPSLYCAVIVKRVDEKRRAETRINELFGECSGALTCSKLARNTGGGAVNGLGSSVHQLPGPHQPPAILDCIGGVHRNRCHQYVDDRG